MIGRRSGIALSFTIILFSLINKERTRHLRQAYLGRDQHEVHQPPC
jgi:hypothetical protein